MNEHSEVLPRPRVDTANEVAVGIVAGMFWLVFASIGVVVAGVVGLGVVVATWANSEPEFSAPIEWRSTVESDFWRGDESPVLIRLESDGSAWVERFPIADGTTVLFAEGCLIPQGASTYSGPASWEPGTWGSVELEFLGSSARVSAYRQNWAAPEILGCDDVFDIELDIVCGDPGNTPPEGWRPCEPERRDDFESIHKSAENAAP